jgi:hypothetical protein
MNDMASTRLKSGGFLSLNSWISNPRNLIDYLSLFAQIFLQKHTAFVFQILFLNVILFVIVNRCIPSNIHTTMVQYSYPSPFARAALHFLTSLVLSGEKRKTSLGCRAKI